MLWFRRRVELPESWPALADRSVPGRSGFDDDERAAHDELTRYLLRRLGFEGTRDFPVTDEIRLTIAGNAALIGLGLGPDAFQLARAVIVHPRTIVSKETRPGPAGTIERDSARLAGEAHHDQGPILLTWPDVRYETRHPRTGRNVVVHEFAHKLDMVGGVSDGTPPIGDPQLLARWVDVCTREYRRVRRAEDDGLIREYAGTNPTEFFAVVSELFFTRPVDMLAEHPDLYELYCAVYRQDPAARLNRAGAG